MQGGEQNQNWMPLQSNPGVITTFMNKLGLKTQQYCAHEMLSTEEWAQQMIPKPVLGVIFLFETTPVQIEFKNQQDPSLKPEQVPASIFFMKQYALNACGTIALFHIIINVMDKYPGIVLPDSYLEKFKQGALTKSAQDKGKMFKQNKNLLNQHKQASSEGQSQCQSSVNSHFISFIQKQGHLFELDGMKKCPVDHGLAEDNQLLDKAAKVIEKYMIRDPENLNFSMIVIAKKDQDEN